jgi:GT2 family glycosyltransferase
MPGSPDTPDRHGISIVVVNANARDALDACLHSLEAQHDLHFELLVVDRGSADGSQELVKSRYPRARLVDLGEDVGAAEALNRGVGASTLPWVLVLDADTLAEPSLIETLRRELPRVPDRIGMLQCRALAKLRPERTDATGVVLLADGTATPRDRDAIARRDDRLEEIFCPTGFAALYRRSMLEEIALSGAPFDAAFTAGMEDVDLGWRARLAGWGAQYVPEAIVHRTPRPFATRKARALGAELRRNRLRTLIKNASPAMLARSLPRTALDLAELVATTRVSGVIDLVRALKGAVDARAEIERLRRLDRRTVERQWVARKAPR